MLYTPPIQCCHEYRALNMEASRQLATGSKVHMSLVTLPCLVHGLLLLRNLMHALTSRNPFELECSMSHTPTEREVTFVDCL